MIIINVCKNFGMYSRDCYSLLKKYKVGHCGTLDKYAKGVLVVLINNATKLSQKITNYNKSYFFTVLFGCDTVTNDLFGKLKKLVLILYLKSNCLIFITT